MASAVAILNPKAGGGRALRLWPRYEKAIRAAGVDLETRQTEAPGHASELAREAAEQGADTLVCVGGDGAANETVNGLFRGGEPIRESLRFAYVPAAGMAFLREFFSRDGLGALLKLVPLYLFVSVFWALFDQTGSTWIFQAQDMERQFLGFEWLPSQVQSLNSLFVLTFIPLFTFGLYPAISKVWKLTPLRKIGMGLFLMSGAFSLSSLIQVWIEAGKEPSIAWQILAYALLTAAEVMVSIVGLEFAYTQAPKRMKSFVMSLFYLSISAGNLFTAAVNQIIQNPDGSSKLEGAMYHLFFAGFMGTAAILFAIYMFYYKHEYIIY